MWKLIAFVLPLAVDSFAVAALLGAGGVTPAQRRRITAVFVAFEAGMPLIGLALGAPVARAIGGAADYVAGAALVVLGGWMLFFGDEEGEEQAAGRLASASGWALVGLGVSISLDELAIGFTLGLVHLPAIPVIIAIAVQTLVVAQLGMRLGARVGEELRENAERLAAIALVGLGVYVLLTRALSH